MLQNRLIKPIIRGLLLAACYCPGKLYCTEIKSPEHTIQFSYLNSSAKERYLVRSPICRIPYIDPDKLYMNEDYVSGSQKCDKSNIISSVTSSEDGYILHINSTLSNGRHVSCCFQQIVRTYDNAFEFTHCKPIFEFTNLAEISDEFIRVGCSPTDPWMRKPTYTNFHFLVQKGKLKQKPRRRARSKMSVMIVGLDSVSRLSFLQQMPKAAEYFKVNGWIEYKGYNKIGDNTFENIAGGVLTGLRREDLDEIWRSWEHADNCPFVWKNFSNAGYITAYAEDEINVSTFNYRRNGFKNPPTDFYLRPYFMALEAGPGNCLRQKLRNLLETAKNIWNSLPEYPLFGLFWSNLPHNQKDVPRALDLPLSRFFQSLNETGTLENTFIVFLSDHGVRTGSYRPTYLGWLEERLPVLYFWVPQWFRTTFPEKYNNLRINSERLTSPYDLHMTLLDILRVKEKAKRCPTCKSLFSRVAWNRSCSDAGISSHWCTCGKYKNISIDNPRVKRMVDNVVSYLNSLLDPLASKMSPKLKCATLKRGNIVAARQNVAIGSTDYDEYVLVFFATPGNGLFEATVQDFYENVEVVSSVSRLNLYGSSGNCIEDKVLRKYCFCVKRKVPNQ